MGYFDELLHRYRSKGILVDTNLLLLYFVGRYDPDRISRFKRTQSFSEDDFLLLASILAFFNKIVVTPNILTEVNSLSNQLPDDIKASYYSEFAQCLDVLEEHYISSSELARTNHFLRFGLTDAGIVSLVQGSYLVLTDDLKLASYLQRLDIDVINFNNIRSLNWGREL
ncbi:MAG: hypothetical protein M3R15_34990 [Acidobacteriota bacterium]|nr:hypothetical protein [Acidobacteriota bacterium]